MNVFELMGSIELQDENFIRGVNNARRSMQQLQTAFNNSTRTVDRNVDRSMQNAGRSSSQGARRVETASDNMSQSLRQANRSFDSTARTASRDFEQLGTEAQRGSRRVEDSVDNAAKHSEKSVGKMSAGMIAKAQIMAQAIVGIVSKVADGAKQIATSAIEGYGNYQQLTGGIQKLYGNMGQSLIDYAIANGQTVEEAKAQWQSLEKAQNTMIRNAKAGWKTAGMSANDYMQNVTGFSAALINSLGGDTQKAADIADMAMQDISDNVNTFGTGSVQDIADVYRAISKGQYQTLDNLNLGFAGTKEGMQKLIDKANELQKANGKAGELSVDSFSDIVEAIHEVQGSMSITGTTSREAMGTVEGSINMAKSAWQNFVAGLGDKDAGMKQLTENLIEAGGAVLENLKPVVKQIIEALGEILAAEIPKIAEKIPQFIADSVKRTSDILKTVMDNLLKIDPMALALNIQEFFSLALNTFTTLAPQLFDIAIQMIYTFVTGLGQAAQTMIPQAVETILNTIVNFIRSGGLTKLLSAGMNLISGLLNGILKAIPQVVSALPQLIDGILDFITTAIPQMIDAGMELFMSLVQSLPEIVESIVQNLPQIIDRIAQFFAESGPSLIEGFVQLFMSLAQAMPTILAGLGQLMVALGEALVQAFMDSFHIIVDIVPTIWDGIKTGVASAWNAIKQVVVNAWNAIDESTGGKLSAIATAVSTAWDAIKTAIGTTITTIGNVISTGFNAVKTVVSTVFNAVKTAIEKPFKMAYDTVKGIISKLKSLFNFKWKLPDLKVPHLRIEGGEAPYGLFGKGSLPKVSVDWYAKAMQNPMLLTRPTIFGYMGDQLLAGGEAGPEVVSGVNPLLNMMRNAASSGNGRRDAMLSMIVELLSQYLPDISTGQDPEALFQAFDRRLGEAMI